jgi:hypothetical protein
MMLKNTVYGLALALAGSVGCSSMGDATVGTNAKAQGAGVEGAVTITPAEGAVLNCTEILKNETKGQNIVNNGGITFTMPPGLPPLAKHAVVPQALCTAVLSFAFDMDHNPLAKQNLKSAGCDPDATDGPNHTPRFAASIPLTDTCKTDD